MKKIKTRDIRFRVWDNGEKQYLPEDVYCVLNRTEFGAFGQMTKDWKDYREGEYFYDASQLLEQFTGLTDKNGKEIFEGDRVVYTLNHDSTQKEIESVVEWYKHAWRLNRLWLLTEICSIEVIGNIHDNPELVN